MNRLTTKRLAALVRTARKQGRVQGNRTEGYTIALGEQGLRLVPTRTGWLAYRRDPGTERWRLCTVAVIERMVGLA